MKVICNRAVLLEGLLVAGSVATTRTTKPTLQCVKLTAADDRLVLTATDLEVAIRYSDSQVQIEKPGEVLLPAEKIRDIVRESQDDTLAIDASGENATVRGQDSVYKIFTQNASDFPAVGDFEGEADFQIKSGTIKLLISQTRFAVARESTRYAFNGVLISAKGKKITLVGTDGRRLALANGDLVDGVKGKEELRAIVPTKALAIIESLEGDPEETISFRITENQIFVRSANATLASNLLEGQFPPYQDVIPKDTDKKLTATTAELTAAIRRAAALITTDETRNIRFAFTKKGLVLTSKSPEAGEATVNLPCRFEGEDIEIGYNAMFMLDAMKVAAAEEVTLEMNTPSRPGLLRAGENFLYVIMPINIQ